MNAAESSTPVAPIGMPQGMVWNYRPSNGTEGDIHRQWTCGRCTVDHNTGWHDGEGDNSCPILMSSLSGPYDYPNPGPPEWGHDFESGEYVCTGFQGPCSCDEDGA